MPFEMQRPPPSTAPPRSIAVLGSTGTIGQATLRVVEHLGAPWRIVGLSAHRRTAMLLEQARRTGASTVVVTDRQAWRDVQRGWPADCRLWGGAEGLVELASAPEVDIVVAAVVGAAGMMSTLAAARAGKRLALANKESLVVAGSLVTAAATESGAEIIPVDSEHSAIFQAMRTGQRREIKRVILTASGGPFRSWTPQQIEHASVEDALDHPTWNMGRKITIDSATMMNKALEIVEARWLFDLAADQIDVVVHPQSIVHSMIEFIDGSVVAQLSPPDMSLPIQYALTFPERKEGVCPKLQWQEALTLEFEPVDLERFPAIELGWEVVRRGGSCGAVVNAANEVAVEAFLNRQLPLPRIVAGCRAVLEAHHFDPNPSLDDLLRLDAWARKETRKWIGT
ncbi:MAG: 1-deoxy-D-xylulose 5-phosphate reductoisomerase [Pirellulaceae bacterium]|nr:MAG: 1-deoxy-D-xylulose 5-phosphate reductoisomerase [Pirellulaceae bacterium]